MPPLLDGLLHPEQDFTLLAFSIHDPTTYAVLTRSAILSNQVATFPESPIPRSPTLLNIPSAVKLPPPAQLSRGYDLEESLAKRHLATGRAALILPHLQLPWASSLIETVWNLLHIRIVVPDPPESYHLSNLISSVVEYSKSITSPIPTKHRITLSSIYKPLSNHHRAYNQVILNHIRQVYKPHVLRQIGICVRLNFVNSVVNAIQNNHQKAVAALLAANSCSPLWMNTKSQMKNQNDFHHRHETNNNMNKKTPYAGVIASNRPLPTSGATSLRVTRLGAAETGFVGTPSRKISFLQLSSRIQSSTSVPPTNLASSSRSAVSVKAHRISEGTISGRDSSYLVHGVVVPGSLLESVSKILSGRYGINILIPGRTSTPPPASLASLSIRGSASSMDIGSSSLSTDTPRSNSRISEGRGPILIDDDVDLYLMDTFGVPWPTACTSAVRDAKIAADKQRKRQLAETENNLEQILKKIVQFRDQLIGDMVSLEVAGSKLSRICAFALAQHSNTSDIEKKLEMFAREYTEKYGVAKRWIKQLEDCETKPEKLIFNDVKVVPR